MFHACVQLGLAARAIMVSDLSHPATRHPAYAVEGASARVVYKPTQCATADPVSCLCNMFLLRLGHKLTTLPQTAPGSTPPNTAM